LLTYGIPDFKLEKWVVERRLQLMEAEGVVFRPSTNVGRDVTASDLTRDYDAICLAGGAPKPRDLPVPGRELHGDHFALDYLTLQNKRGAGDPISDEKFISAKGKNVVILGGGDTGADCLGTALRQGAKSVRQFELMARPPEHRTADMPWPEWPFILRESAAH